MREGLSVSVCRHWHQTLCKLLQSETLWWWALQSGTYYWAERKWTIRWGVVNHDSSHVKSQCRTVLATSNAITCLWHCGMRHRGGSTVFCERVKLPCSTRPMIHYSNRAHRRSLVVGSLKNYCRKVLHIWCTYWFSLLIRLTTTFFLKSYLLLVMCW